MYILGQAPLGLSDRGVVVIAVGKLYLFDKFIATAPEVACPRQ